LTDDEYIHAEVGEGLATGGILKEGEGAGLATGGYLEYEAEAEIIIPPVVETPQVPGGGIAKKIPRIAGILKAWNGIEWTTVTTKVFSNTGAWIPAKAMMFNGIEWCSV